MCHGVRHIKPPLEKSGKGSEEWREMEANFLLKAVTIASGLVWVVDLKALGWLEVGVVMWSPDSVLISLKKICFSVCVSTTRLC